MARHDFTTHGAARDGVTLDTADVRVRDCDVLWRGDRRGDYGSVLVARQTPGLVVEDVRGSAARPGLLDIDVHSAEPLLHAGSRPGGS